MNATAGIFVFVAVLMTHTSLAAAEMTITILEKGTGDFVPEATVVNLGNGEFEQTDKFGRLVLEDVELPVKIKILAIGYQTLIQEYSVSNPVIYLEPFEVEGEGLEVVADRVKEKTSKISLRQQELRSVAGTQGDPIKMLETLPGVVAQNGGGSGGDPNNIFIRGSSGGENSFWINRIPVDYLYHVWGISVINPGLVDNFNIFLGGFPVEYDDVLGGVVDIQLRSPQKDRFHQTYRVAINESAALLEGPINETQSFYVAGRASYIDKVLQPFAKDISKLVASGNDSETEISVITFPRYWDAQANWHYELRKARLDLYYFGSNDGLRFDIKQLETSDPDLIGKINVDYGFHTVAADGQYRLTPKVNTRITSSLKRGHQLQTFGTDSNGKPFGVDLNIYEGLFHPSMVWSMNSHLEITTGGHAYYGVYPVELNISSLPSEENFSGRNFSSREKFQATTEQKFASASPYVKTRLSYKALTAIAGLRYSRLLGSGGVDMDAVSPRLGVEYQLLDNLLITAAWGRYIQAPNPAVLLPGYGNPSLGFTEAEHRILGLQYRFMPLWSAQVELYHKPMQRLILTRPFRIPPDTYQNDGEGEAYGLDVLIKRDYGNRRMGWLGYSYARSSRTLIDGSDRLFSGDQPHSFNVVWSQPFPADWNKWSWGFKIQANSGRPYTPVVGRVAFCDNGGANEVCQDQQNADSDPGFQYWSPIYGERNILRRPFFHQLDLRIDRLIRYDTWTMKLYLDLLNVTLQDTVVNYDYGKNYEDYRHPRKSGFPPIILPFFGLEAQF